METLPELLAAGWPGENPSHEAGLNRVYVALSSLRKMGLRELLHSGDDGYQLEPRVVVSIQD